MNASVQIHDKFAADYDRQVREYHCYAADILFGLCFECVHPGERLLDLGIGTGLSALPFARSGLVVVGADASAQMLQICRSKGIAAELDRFDLQTTPWPYPDGSFDHAVACGLLHFICDLQPILAQVARVLKRDGIFAFTTKARPEASEGTCEETAEDVTVFMHGRAYVERCLASSGFEMLKDVMFSVGDNRTGPLDFFLAFVVRKRVG